MADDDVVDSVIDHAETIGHHAERIKAVEEGQAAIGGLIADMGTVLDGVRNRIEDVAQAQIQTAQDLAELKVKPAVQEELQTAEDLPKPDEDAPTVDAPEQTTPENTKKKSPLDWFHKVLGGGE
jgi:hypothetical protein